MCKQRSSLEAGEASPLPGILHESLGTYLRTKKVKAIFNQTLAISQKLSHFLKERRKNKGVISWLQNDGIRYWLGLLLKGLSHQNLSWTLTSVARTVPTFPPRAMPGMSAFVCVYTLSDEKPKTEQHESSQVSTAHTTASAHTHTHTPTPFFSWRCVIRISFF